MDDSARAQSYREQAQRLREKAAHMNSPEIREAMEEMAAQYERLAKSVDPSAK